MVTVMNVAKTLNRDEMRKIMAGNIDSGCESGGPGPGECQQCCWEGTDICSDCIYNSAGVCVEGAELVDC